MRYRAFVDDPELLAFAEKILTERLRSLEGDTAYCLAGGGVFPALLYGFATVDLLGALLSGKTRKGVAETTKQAKTYMEKFMSYPATEAGLIQDLFRHKLVHLAQPAPVVHDRGQLVTWQLWPDNAGKHRLLEPDQNSARLASSLTVTWTHRFNLAIRQFNQDIRTSVEGVTGYVAALRNDPALRVLFDQAVADMHIP